MQVVLLKRGPGYLGNFFHIKALAYCNSEEFKLLFSQCLIVVVHTSVMAKVLICVGGWIKLEIPELLCYKWHGCNARNDNRNHVVLVKSYW